MQRRSREQGRRRAWSRAGQECFAACQAAAGLRPKPGAGARFNLRSLRHSVANSCRMAGSREARPRPRPRCRRTARRRWWRRRAGPRRLFDVYARARCWPSPRRSRRRRPRRRAHMPTGRSRRPASAIAEHKEIKNRLCSIGLFEHYRNDELHRFPHRRGSERSSRSRKPAGVIFALTPSTNPVCSVFYKAILALLTRNAIVISPHPMRQGLLRRRRAADRARPRRRPARRTA